MTQQPSRPAEGRKHTLHVSGKFATLWSEFGVAFIDDIVGGNVGVSDEPKQAVFEHVASLEARLAALEAAARAAEAALNKVCEFMADDENARHAANCSVETDSDPSGFAVCDCYVSLAADARSAVQQSLAAYDAAAQEESRG